MKTTFFNGMLTGALALALTGLMLSNSVNKSDSTAKPKGHRIVFQLSTPDTLAYRALSRQLNNVLNHWPDAQLEVVAHNKGIQFLIADKTNVGPEIAALKARGVNFWACENTLKQQKLDKSVITSHAGFVPVGIAQIAGRQEEGWSYIKAGF